MFDKPAVIWAVDFDNGSPEILRHDFDVRSEPCRSDFRWLHLNLADQCTRRWINSADEIPAEVRDMLLSGERYQQALVGEGFIGCILHDVEREFDRHDAERTGTLRIALGPNLMITARHHPIRSADIVKQHIERREAQVTGPASALNLIVSSIVENIASVSREQAGQIETFEDILLDHPESFDHRKLIDIRRRTVQFHRLLSGMQSVFKRLEQDEDTPERLLPTIEKLAQQLGDIDSEQLAIQGQLRLLREEADLQAAQRTNQNLYVLSMLSAVLLPPTLIVGFFGMNTGGLPMTEFGGGTLIAILMGIASSLGVYWLLRSALNKR